MPRRFALDADTLRCFRYAALIRAALIFHTMRAAMPSFIIFARRCSRANCFRYDFDFRCPSRYRHLFLRR